MPDKPEKSRRQALGRGLSALISSPTPADPEVGGVPELPIDRIDPGSFQPRSHFDARSLEELAASIRRHGILQPLVVIPRGARYELVAGERRLRAAKLAGLKTIPAIVRDFSHDQQLEIGLIENVQRADLNPIEEARGYIQLMDTFNLGQQDVADRIGKSRAYIANKVRLVNLPEELQALLAEGRLTEGHARALLAIPDPNEMLAAAAEVVDKGLNVRATEELARRRTSKRRRNRLEPDWEALRRNMETALGTPVTLQRSRKGGSIAIRFFSDEQFEAVYKRLTNH